MNIGNILLIAGTLLLVNPMQAQDGLVRRANKEFNKMAFAEAIPLYERASTKGASNEVVALKLATSYRKIRDMRNAEIWYARAVEMPNATAKDLYYYSEALRSNGKFELADQWMKKYEGKAPGDSRVDRQANSVRYTDKLMNEGLSNAKVTLLESNTSQQDMGPMLNGDRLVFASSRTPEVASRNTHTWNDAPFLDLYCGHIEPNGQLTDIEQHAPELNTKFHESNACFSKDGKIMWFTRNNFYRGKVTRTSAGVNNLKIFHSTFQNGSWGREVPFLYNSNEYSVGHPSLSEDGNTLYFTTDMPGGMGGTDIYRCTKTADGWGEPQNMGSSVNTEGNEMFPFIHSSGILYFASDGHRGFGGLDNFAAKVVEGKVTDVKNVGAPVNSGADDFALVFDASSKKGYFTSNRSTGKGDDDIYSVVIDEPIAFELFVQGVATTQEDGTFLPNTKVKLMDAQGNVLNSDITNEKGEYKFLIQPDADYNISAESEGRDRVEKPFTSKGIKGGVIKHDVALPEAPPFGLWAHVTDAKTKAAVSDVEVSIVDAKGNSVVKGSTNATGDLRKAMPELKMGDQVSYKVSLKKDGFFPRVATFSHRIDALGELAIHQTLDLTMQPVEVGADVGKAINISPIYFDLGKYNIRKDASAELDKIVEVMTQYPTMAIELGSHTDSRGSAKSNESLSDRRAKSSAAYIVSKGITSDRVTGKGYGETRLENKCADGVKCSEEEHQLNRRTEFIIVKM